MRTYDRIYKDGRIGQSGSDIVEDYINHQRGFYSAPPGIEQKLERLVFLIGQIADHANVNLLEIMDASHLSGRYEVHTDKD